MCMIHSKAASKFKLEQCRPLRIKIYLLMDVNKHFETVDAIYY